MSAARRLIVGVSGATGAVYAKRMLELLREQGGVETHLVVSAAGFLTIRHELGMDRRSFGALADHCHNHRDVGALLASGSFQTCGMVVAPCSMHSLACIANGLADNLLARAADVSLKERRRLVLMVREAPFNLAHLRNMTAVSEMGGVIFPPLPAFYLGTSDLAQLIDHTVVRVLQLFDINIPGLVWQGLQKPEHTQTT